MKFLRNMSRGRKALLAMMLYLISFGLIIHYSNIGVAVGVFLLSWANNIDAQLR